MIQFRLIPPRLPALALCLVLLCLPGCERVGEWLSPSPAYEVVFDKDPMLSLDAVRAKGVVIGKTVSRELAGDPAGSLVVVTIRIDKKYQDMMRQNAVFVSENGALEYESAGPQGPPLTPGSRILGFANQGDYFAFQAKSLIMDWSGALMEELRRLLEEKQKPRPPAQSQGDAT